MTSLQRAGIVLFVTCKTVAEAQNVKRKDSEIPLLIHTLNCMLYRNRNLVCGLPHRHCVSESDRVRNDVILDFPGT